MLPFFFPLISQGCTWGTWNFPDQGSNPSYSCCPTPQPEQRGSKLHLRPSPQFMAMLDAQLTEQGQGLNVHPRGYQLHYFPQCHNRNALIFLNYEVISSSMCHLEQWLWCLINHQNNLWEILNIWITHRLKLLYSFFSTTQIRDILRNFLFIFKQWLCFSLWNIICQPCLKIFNDTDSIIGKVQWHCRNISHVVALTQV